MSLRTMSLAVAVAGLCAPLSVSAQTPAPEVGVQESGSTAYQSERVLDFEDDYVEGQLLRPDGELVSGQRHGKESSLVRIRQDFVPELVQSVEDL